MRIINLTGIILALFFLLFFPVWIIKYLTFSFLIINIFSYLYSRITGSSISISHKSNIIRSYKNQNIEIELTLRNKSFLPVNNIYIKDDTGLLSLKETGKFLVRLNGFEKISLKYSVNAHKRGAYIIGPVKLSGSDPLGFFPWEKTAGSFSKVIIYPDIYDFFINVREGTPVGIIKSKNKIYEDTTLFRTVREYINGDDLKRINWKISAKMNRLYTMEYEYTLNSPVLILLNLNLNEYPLRYRYIHAETAIEVASSLIFYFINRKEKIGLISNGTISGRQVFHPVKGGHNHAVMILESLAEISPTENEEKISGMIKKARMQISSGTRIILITPAIGTEELYGFYRFKKENMLFNIFLINEEKRNIRHEIKKRLGIDLFYYRLEERKILYEKTAI